VGSNPTARTFLKPSIIVHSCPDAPTLKCLVKTYRYKEKIDRFQSTWFHNAISESSETREN